jgi:glycosyltransferase involved in cell wall biosynthesis
MCDGPRRILYIDSGSGVSGGQFSLLEILRTLDRSRYTPLAAVVPGSGLEERCAELGVPWFGIPFQTAHASSDIGTSTGGRIKDAWRSLKGIGTITGLIRRESVDIVHTNTFKATLVGGLAALITRRPFIFHDRIMLKHWPLGGLAALVSDRVIAVCNAVRDKHVWPSRRKVIVIPSGINTDRLSPVPQDGPSMRVCYLGRMTGEKGVDTLVEAAAIVVGKVPDARFVFAGSPFTAEDGLFLDRIRRRIAELGLEQHVDFTGQVEDVPGLMAGCDLIVLPSRREAVGRVSLEAGAMGKPIVASATGGLRQSVRDGESGILVAPGDVRGFADAIVRLLTDRELAERMGRRGREIIASGYSSELTTRRIMAVYDEILASRTP